MSVYRASAAAARGFAEARRPRTPPTEPSFGREHLGRSGVGDAGAGRDAGGRNTASLPARPGRRADSAAPITRVTSTGAAGPEAAPNREVRLGQRRSRV
jgi:hypothetical protein